MYEPEPMDEIGDLIGDALDCMDEETLALRIYVEGADSPEERVEALRSWARDGTRPSNRQIVDFIKAIRRRATGLESIARGLEDALRDRGDS